MKKVFLITLFVLSAVIAFAQDCYNYTRSLGISYYDKGQYSVAKSQFSAAKSCPDKPGDNDLDAWIRKCDDAIADANRKVEEEKARQQKAEAERKMQEERQYASKGYMDIREIRFGTEGAGETAYYFYTTLNANDIKYLVPRIYYDGLGDRDRKIKLFVKIYGPDGMLKRGTTSPDGYTYSNDMTVYQGKNNYYSLMGWGTADGGYYKAGTNRIELWYDGKMIYKQSFTLTETNDLIISDAQFSASGNTGTFYNTLDAADITYLTPRICYDGLVSVSKKVTLYVKIINPDGTLHTGASSPDGYSYSDEITVSSGRNNYCTLMGWGSDSGGTYDPGTYKIEIWQEGKMLYQKFLTITGKKVLDIKMVRFGTRGENEKDSDINFYPSLCASDIKYLVPKITYDGLNYGTKTIRIYVKIFKPDGTMMKGSNSPTGYTYSSKVAVAYGTYNSCTVSGWGTASGGSYSPGTYRIEFWYGGNMLYNQKFQLTSGKQNSQATSSGQDSYVAGDPLIINNIDFANVKGRKPAKNFSSSLYAKKVRYLTPRIWYDGKVRDAQIFKIYVKIFNPNGTLSKSSSSPNGYTYSRDVTIYPRRNCYCILTGWGTSSGGSYYPGTHRIEIWYDGKMLYKQNFVLY